MKRIKPNKTIKRVNWSKALPLLIGFAIGLVLFYLFSRWVLSL